MSNLSGLEAWRQAQATLPVAVPLHASVLFALRSVKLAGAGFIAGTDGVRLMWSPEKGEEKVRNLDDAMFVLLHEAEHVMRMHTFRRGDRDPRLWNIACDFVINGRLLKSVPAPSGAPMTLDDVVAMFMGATLEGSEGLRVLHDDRLAGKSEEEIYDILLDMLPDQHGDGGGGQDEQSEAGDDGDDGDGGGHGGQDQLDDGDQDQQDQKGQQEQGGGRGNPLPEELADLSYDNEGDAAVRETARAKVKGAIEAALREAKVRGTEPAWMKELLGKLGEMEPKVDWRRKLAHLFRLMAGSMSELTYSQPNRWSMVTGSPVVMPGELRYGVDKVVLAVDTSGSMDAELLRRAFAEVRYLTLAAQPDRIVLVQCDTEVQSEETLTAQELVHRRDVEAKGRGGTAFQPVFDLVREKHADAQMVVYFTDGYGDSPTDPGVPVLWVVINNDGYLSAQFGDVVHVKED